MNLKCVLISGLLLLSVDKLFAQKAPLTVKENGEQWAAPGETVISDDGHYFLYGIRNQPAGSSTLVIRATDGDWKTELTGLSTGSFTKDSRKALFMKGDSLCLMTLGTGAMEYVPGTAYFQQFKQGSTEWLVIQKSNEKQELVLRNLNKGEEFTYAGVSQFLVSPAGNALVLNKAVKDTTGMRFSLSWLSLPDLKVFSMMETTDQLSNFAFDKAGTQLAFIVSKTNGTYDDVNFNRGIAEDVFKPQIDKKNNKINTIYRYQPGVDKAQLWADDHTPGIEAGLKVGSGGLHFSKDGARLFFKLEKVPVPLKMKEKPVMVEVWSYTDAYLQPEQQMPPSGYFEGKDDDYVAVMNKKDNKVIQLQQPNDYYNLNTEGDDFIIMNTYKGAPHNPSNDYWQGGPQIYLVSAIDGSRKPLPETGQLSPSGKYLYYFDQRRKNYFTYEIGTGITRNISANIPTSIYKTEDDGIRSPVLGFYGLTWLKDDSGVLIPDQYDLWLTDPKGARTPINITGGYGRKHGIILRLLQTFGTAGLSANADLLLFGFNDRNKDNAYFRKKLGTPGDPLQLTTGAYAYGGINNNIHGATLLHSEMPEPVKAKNADVFILERGTEKDAPNLFLTKDFKQLTRLTDLQPQKQFNWYTTELVNWKKLDGKIAQGILYKPENFDPKKKYPLIFWYYEENSAALHSFLLPEPSGGDLNIPYFVSNGYLVFGPDISHKQGAPGEGAYNAVISAAKYLAKRPYVNSKKMGITGHSFGGYETNYLVSRTSLFAAALSASGYSDLVSSYGSLKTEGTDMHGFFEIRNSQMKIGKSLWQDPDAYINSSPIFRADKVTTPLLIMHSKKDGIVRWSEAVEWFTALRRLGKKVWLLQYDNEKHVLVNPNNTVDFTIRMTQFFDHYLKDAPVPKWMIEGISAKMKGIDDGLMIAPR